MKTSGISQIVVFCGLALGVMALWVSAAPIGVNGDQVIGGWYSHTTNPPEYDEIGCTSSSGCSACSGITYVYCYNGPVDKDFSCHGGEKTKGVREDKRGQAYLFAVRSLRRSLLRPLGRLFS